MQKNRFFYERFGTLLYRVSYFILNWLMTHFVVNQLKNNFVEVGGKRNVLTSD